MTNSKIGVLVPAYNEAVALPATLEALSQQERPPEQVVIIENASTDATQEIAQAFAEEHENFSVISEPQKGTGYAVRKGARFLIDNFGIDILARTDADTVPNPNWASVIEDYFAQHTHKALLGGITLAKDDEHCRPIDKLLTPANFLLGRPVYVAVYRRLWPLRMAYGHNMATRTEVYDQVGGFRPGSIDTSEEDDLYSEAIHEEFGFNATGISLDLIVRTSPRRIRKVGYRGMLGYYLDKTREGRLKRADGEIDIR